MSSRLEFTLDRLKELGHDWPREQDDALERLGLEHGAVAVCAANERGDVLVMCLNDGDGIIVKDPATAYAIKLDGRVYEPLQGLYAGVPKPSRYRVMEPAVSARA